MSAATEALAFAAAIAIADDTGELDEVLSEMLADPDVDWATISIKLARICAALVQSSLEDEGVYDGVEDVVQWLYDLSEELHPGWYEEAEGDS